MKKQKLTILLLAVLTAVGYNMYTYSDGEAVTAKTQLRESDIVSARYSKDIFYSFENMELTGRQLMEAAEIISGFKLKRVRTDGYLQPDSLEETRLTAKSSLDSITAAISITGTDCLTVYRTGRDAEYYTITDGDPQQLHSFISLLARENIIAEDKQKQFSLSCRFPDGWQCVKREENADIWASPYPLFTLEDVYDIFDENGNHIGAYGSGSYGEKADSLWERYVSIALPNMYSFNVPPSDDLSIYDGSYRSIHTYSYGKSATTKVYHSPQIQQNSTGKAFYNYGLLCHNDEKSVFVAMEFSPQYVDSKTLYTLAYSTEIE